MVDYKNGKVYKILNTITDDVYVGSTCQSLSKRMANHRGSINSNSKGHRQLYEKMKKLGVGNFYIELIEECPCDNIEQLNAAEGKYIRELSTLNQRVEGRSRTQYEKDRKEQKVAYDKEYYQTNMETKKEMSKLYYQENRECIKEKRKIYFQEKHTCLICGGRYTISHKQAHLRTNKHLKAAASQTDSTSTGY